MRTIIWFIYFWLYLVAVFPASLYIKYQIKNGRKPVLLIDKMVHNWAAHLLSVAGVKVEIQGLENLPSGGALLVCNHQGNFDIPILLAYLDKPKSIVAKKELSKLPGITSWMKFFDCLFMDRSNPRQSLQIMKEAQGLIDNGQHVIIFPEGTRSKGDIPGEFKAGALKSALKSGCPIVPIAMNGSYRVMEEHGFSIHPATVKMTVLPPIATAHLNKDQASKLHDDIRQLIMKTNNL